jgi:hypothetical protein|tara:strand:+ start:580 stop:1050 length:471 start_codon:yes stop_codon:yes gene_type:complete
MKFYSLLILLIIIPNSLQFHNYKKCHKKLRIGFKFLKLRVVPQISEETKNRLLELETIESKRALIESSIDASSTDVVDELSDLYSVVTNTNKEFLFVFQQIISQYIKYNIIDNVNKKYELEFETLDLVRIIIRNIIVPTIIHDSFQTFIHYIGIKS